ncbi:MAG: MBL fold metallo-hydrolase [Alphaproteobacteria bacterium]|nr:MBL fold metallo-hydrolase [Alphaproteobacteria bacterium]
MFELVFLGTAAAVPSVERGLPALLVARGARRLLIDCGEGTQRQLMRAGSGFRGLQHVLLTHAHLDHVLGLAGLLATLALYRVGGTIEIIGSGETIAFARRYLAETIGPERDGGYRLRSVSPGPVLSFAGWRLDAFAVAHRGTESLGYLFRDETRHPMSPERLDALGVPEGPERAMLASGRPIVLADGRRISPEEVQGPSVPGAKLAVIGDAEEVATLVEPVRGADTLVIEATFLERDAALARARGHLTAAEAGRLAHDADVSDLLLTHISGRHHPEEILAEALSVFPAARVVADFDCVTVAAPPKRRRSQLNS